MGWETTVWLSVALVVATSALHLTIEHDLLGEQAQPTTTTIPSIKESVQDVVNSVSGFEELTSSAEADGNETDPVSAKQTNSNERSAQNMSRSKEVDEGNAESLYSDTKGGTINEQQGEANGGDNNDQTGGGSNGGNDDETEGGSNGGNDDQTEDGSNGGNDGQTGGGSNGGNDDQTGGGSDGGNDDQTGGGSNGDNDDQTGGGSNGDNDDQTGGGSNGDNDDQTGGGSNGGNDNDTGDEQSPGENGGDETGNEGNVVTTTTGPVRGHAWRENEDIISYIDIPYGTFNSHFKVAVSPDPWESIHEVKEHSKRCPQLQDGEYVGDDDCLTLSIFKPSDAANADVLLHIHEGNFTDGSANPAIYGPEYLVSKGIILVLPNYRLGPLGFLCLQNETALGNAALKDLTLALSWTKANIEKFGGNPENIAVSGDGTAGALAGYLALSPMSRQNISKVITESGAVLAHWAFDRNPVVAAAQLANKLGVFSSWESIETRELVTAAKDVILRPCLERNLGNGSIFMVETPSTMIENHRINITFMIGSAKHAGAHEILKHTDESIQQFNNNVGLLLPNDLHFETTEERNRAGNRVRTRYFNETVISKAEVERLSRYFTDAGYLGPGIRTARSLVNSGATVYFYEFSFVGDLNREFEALDLSIDGAVRGDMTGYLFTQDGVVPGESKERDMVDQLIQLWTTFLRTGTPSAENIEWNKFENAAETAEEWLSIETETSPKQGLHVDRLGLWTEIYNQFYIERNIAIGTSPSVYTVLVLQTIFFISFFKNASHFF